MRIAVEIGDRAAEGRAYGSLENAYDSLGVSSSSGQYIRPSSCFKIFLNNVNCSTGFSSLSLYVEVRRTLYELIYFYVTLTMTQPQLRFLSLVFLVACTSKSFLMLRRI